jgi:hypothetical protein
MRGPAPGNATGGVPSDTARSPVLRSVQQEQEPPAVEQEPVEQLPPPPPTGFSETTENP